MTGNFTPNPAVAIIGAGPAGCAAACFLRLRGVPVTLYDNGKRPDLVVGESLIPAVVPLLRKLGIEQQVQKIATRKPGVSLRHTEGSQVDFNFFKQGRAAPDYAYNVPRDAFDAVLLRRAQELGAQRVVFEAGFDVHEEAIGHRDVSLNLESLSAAGLNRNEHPELLIDATGRSRLFSRLLSLPTARGKRSDVAYFAHFDNFDCTDAAPGQVVISVLKSGWCWRIPLKDCTSVGVVLNRHAAKQLGDNPQQRLLQAIAQEPLIAANSIRARLCSPVKTYTNYQQMTEQSFGPGWTLVGDAYGFVDPMLSPGLFMALESADLCASHALDRTGLVPSAKGLQQYNNQLQDWHVAWQELIEYFYDGRMINLVQAGAAIVEECARYSTSRLANRHVRKVVGSLVSGTGTRSAYRRAVLRHSARYLVQDSDRTAELAVQG